MADKFVRPAGAHSGTQNGLTYDTAWCGWSAIVWGSGGVVAGDTLYVCDSHTYAEILPIGVHGALVNNRVTIRGDYSGHPGTIMFTAGSYYIDANRDYTSIINLTMNGGTNACISPGGVPLRGLWVKNCIFNCGTDAAIKFRPFSNWSFEDTVIDGNTFNGGTGSVGGGCIQWYVTSAVSSTIKRLTITNNTFTGNSAQRATILLITKTGTALETCSIQDLIVSGNTFKDCNGVAMEVSCLKTVSSVLGGANLGIKIFNNVIRNQGLGTSGLLGGGFSVVGFEPSTTLGFGPNEIYNNQAYGLTGLTGFCNPMYGTYRIYGNYAENISTVDIDGCGLLFDHGCHDSVAYWNEFRDIHGKPTDDFNTGFGVLVLDATNIVCYGNKFTNCLYGVAFGNKQYTDAIYGVQPVRQSANIYNNTFLNCKKAGAYLVGGADNTSNLVRNNIFTGTGVSAPSVKVNSATWTGESNNFFYGFGSPSAHTHGAGTSTADPKIAADGRLKEGSPAIAAGITIGRITGVDRKNFWNPPSRGAYEYVRPRAVRT